MAIEKKDIRAYSLIELQDFFVAKGDKAFRGKQVYQWLWNKGIHQFDEMTNLSKDTRAFLEEHFTINHIAVDQQQRSSDGTIKNAVKLFDGRVVESVLIPVKDRTTACVSSQVCCSLDCKFCATAKLARMRNLNPDEIFDQVVAIDQQSKAYFNSPLSNIVFMGMGEHLMNYKNVLSAIDKIIAAAKLNKKSLGIMVNNQDELKMYSDLGFNMIAVGTEMSILSRSISQILQ